MKKAEETFTRPTEQEANEEADRLINLYCNINNYKLIKLSKVTRINNGKADLFMVKLIFVK